jgi:pimeloyl-ACP methyl ester carboxylesterase
VNCGDDAECTRIEVPLDYANPDGETVELGVTRVKATGQPIGALLVNPGGPGASAFDYAKAANFIVTPNIRENFDIVGVDPRGVGTSEPVQCLTAEEIDQLIATEDDIDTPEGRANFLKLAALPGQACTQRADELFAYMSSVNAARDMDIVRAALDQPVLNFLGKSYGSYLGALYAELFPSRVGRMVLDGILSPEADIVETTRVQSLGLEQAAEAFMADCLMMNDCPFSGTVDDGMDQLRSFFEEASQDPLPTGEERSLNGALASYATLLYLYFPETDYPILRRALRAAIVDGDGAELLKALDARLNRSPDGRYLDNFTDAYYAITCLDQPYDGDLSDAEILAKEWEADSPTFGPGLALGLIVCTDWPATELNRIQSVTAPGAAPILLLSATGDPVTPLIWAEELNASLENSALITLDTNNHTIYYEGSACVDDATDRYLLTGALPVSGLTCPN